MSRYVLSIDWDFFTGDCRSKHGCASCLWKWCNDTQGSKAKKLRRLNDKIVLDAKEAENSLKDIFAWSIWEPLTRSAFHKSELVVADCHGSIRSWIRHGPDKVPQTNQIDLIFFCLSRPYTPPMWDRWFYQAVSDLAAITKTKPRFFGLGAREMRRAWARNKTT